MLWLVNILGAALCTMYSVAERKSVPWLLFFIAWVIGNAMMAGWNLKASVGKR